jgi:hypothetical protein
MNTKYMVIVATMVVMLIGATALTTSESAFAGGHVHKKKTEYNQALSQANACGNGFMPYNVGCQNTASQIQGDDNAATLASEQSFEEDD